tara:strand:+ start:153 stop:389 length:237 start_codon:yes stop_codon:yes gene_type:complete
MSCDMDSDSFHVKKGGRRKTVSSRRAYVNTPRQIKKELALDLKEILNQAKLNKNLAFNDSTILADTLKRIKQTITQLS